MGNPAPVAIAVATLLLASSAVAAAPLPTAPKDGAAAAVEEARRQLLRCNGAAAEAALVEALKADPYLPEAHRLRAVLALRQGATDAATSAANALVWLDPYAADGYALLALAHFRAGRAGEAVEALARGMDNDPDSAAVLLSAARILAAGGSPGEAMALARRAVDLGPALLEARLVLGRLLLASGSREEGLKVLKQAGASGLGAASQAVDLLLEARLPAEAAALLPDMLGKAGETPSEAFLAHRSAARVLLASGADPALAVAAFDAALKAAPNDLCARAGRAEAYVALADLLQGAAATPPAGSLRALALAEEDAAAVLAADPAHSGGLLARAAVLERRGNQAEAEAALATVTGRDPLAAEALGRSGMVRLRAEDPFAAAKVFRSLSETYPGEAHHRLNLATAYLRGGRSPDARREIEAALAGLPGDHPLRAYADDLLAGRAGRGYRNR